MKRSTARENTAMKKMIVLVLLFTGLAIAKNDKNNPAEYPLTAHVVSSNRTGTGGSVFLSDGTYGTVHSSDATVRFQIGDLFYVGGHGCPRRVPVGTDVHARVEKNKLYILTYDGQTCDSHIRRVEEIPKQPN